LPLNPKFAGSNPAEDDGFIRAIQSVALTSFGGEVKPAVPRSKIYGILKITTGVKRDTSYAKFSHLWPSFFCFDSRCLCWLLPESSGG
jgi:hypothetical protein